MDKDQKKLLNKANKLLEKAVAILEEADYEGLASRVEMARCDVGVVLDSYYEEDE